jgi:hypothetical protein
MAAIVLLLLALMVEAFRKLRQWWLGRTRLRAATSPGRIVIGELASGPHRVTSGALRARAEPAGLAFERRVGPRFGCFGVIRRDGD